MKYNSNYKNDTYNKNMKALKNRDRHLANKIDSIIPERYKLVVERDSNLPNLKKIDDSFSFYSKNPLDDAANAVNSLNLNNVKLALFLGIGLGYEIIYFMKEYASKNRTAALLIVEQDLEIFKLALQTTDLSVLIENEDVEWFVGQDEQSLEMNIHQAIQKKQRFVYIKALKPIYNNSSIDLNKNFYLSVIRKVKDYVVFQLNLFGNCPTDSLVGITQMFDNIKEIIENAGIIDLKGKFYGKPAVVVSAGPSLNKNKHLLEGLEDKALIIAVDSAFPILMNMGIKPHMVISLERTITTLKHMEGYTKEEVSDVFYTSCPVVRNEVYKEYKGPKIIVFRDLGQFEWLGIDKGTLKINRSSGNMAYKVASYLQCSPIIIIGQDLAFSRDGRTHASGTAHGEKGERYDAFYNLQRREVMGNDGDLIETNNIWFDFLQGFEMDVAQNKGKTINATEGGAFIRGTEVMTFLEAIEHYLKTSYNPVQLIRNNLKAPSNEEKEKIEKFVLSKIVILIDDMKHIQEHCEIGLKEYEINKSRILELKDKEFLDEDYVELKSLLDSIMKERQIIETRNESYKSLFMLVAQSFHIMFEIEINNIPNHYLKFEDSIPEVLLRFNEWYATMNEFAKVIEERVKEYLNILEE